MAADFGKTIPFYPFYFSSKQPFKISERKNTFFIILKYICGNEKNFSKQNITN